MWFSQAPSNIALIKYMGKRDEDKNIPLNSSLSYTLPDLMTSVSLEQTTGHKDYWEPLIIPGTPDFQLSEKGQTRYLNHLARLKEYFGYEGAFIVRSSNNFPHSSGIASSASSFAALTKCACIALSELTNKPLPAVEEQARLSRLGSGSSCRSFFAPWALWRDENVEAIDLPYKDLIHQVILIEHGEKHILSSEAHKRIKTSKLYESRATQAEENLRTLLDDLRSQDWKSAFHIVWREFHEMHLLFTTSVPSFSYMTADGEELLKQIQNFWNQEKDGPLVTMDAGPNIHLLWRNDQKELCQQFKLKYLLGNFDVL